MKNTIDTIKSLINRMGFLPEDGVSNIYFKKYVMHSNYIIRVNFNTSKIEYRENDVSEEDGIKWGDLTTSNFENSENFVVLECINRLLEKGYAPKNLYLEYKFPLGRNEKGKLDILVFDNDGKAYLMIECKTWGTEFSKETKKMLKNGGQLFSYYVQDKATKYLCLYTSRYNQNEIEYKNNIIKVDEEWAELTNQKEIHDHWNKNTKDNGVFEEWANAYDVEIKALVRSRLLPLTKDDSGRIFNQFAEILRHNVVSDKPNAFNKILNLFICKIIDEDKNDNDQVEFQWLENDTDESLQIRLNDLYKQGMHRFLDIDVTDFSDNDIANTLENIGDSNTQKAIKEMFVKLRLQKNPEFAFIEVYDDTSFKLNAKVVREVVELLQPYQFRYGHKQQFLGDFFELLLNTSIKQEAGQYFTPVPITRYIVSSLPIKEMIENKLKANDAEMLPTVIDFACGTGHFLTEYMDKVQSIIEDEIDISKAKPIARKKLQGWIDYDKFGWASDYVYGIDADYRLVKSSKVSSFLNGDGEANIIRANGLDHFEKSKEYKGKLKSTTNEDRRNNAQFDILIANPPYSVNAFKSTVKYGAESFELFDKLTDKSSEIECLFIERMKQLLRVGGYAAIILPSSVLSNTGIYTATREILFKYFKIVAITEFGSNTFMATNTNTVTLFLKRRSNSDYKIVETAVNSFFDKPKDVTVLGIEKAFSKYVSAVYDNISLEDYISFINRKPNGNFLKEEIYDDYYAWFNNQADVKKLIGSKAFKLLSEEEQNKELGNLFFEKVLNIEQEKIVYFLLLYGQKTVLTKVGEKQEEKAFLGYEFSKSRGHEGIKMLSEGTKLFDENDQFNSEKANYYVYSSFQNVYPEIDEGLQNNISVVESYELINLKKIPFEKIVNLNANVKLVFDTQYPRERLKRNYDIIKGITYDKDDQVYRETSNVILTADNITLNNNFEVTKKVFLDESFKANEAAKLNKDDIFICMSSGSRSHVGKVAYISEEVPYYAGGFMGIIRENEFGKKAHNLLPKYVFSILSSYNTRTYMSNICTGANIKNLNDSDVDIKIPIPPTKVQEKIINEIELVETEENSKIVKHANLRGKLKKAEWFSYDLERLEKLTNMVQRGKSAKYGTSSIQIIKSGQARGYNNFDFSKRYYVSDSFISDERNLQKGDILINSTGVGTAGRVTLFDLDGDFVVDSHITIVRLNQEKVLPKYVLYALANIGFKNIEAMATGQSGQIELALPTVNSIRIPLPDIKTQKDIVSEIEEIEKEMNILEREISEMEEQKNKILENHLK
ncbi:N-6 DNA methylase [Ruminococcus bromii]|uniref:N-6 DNA methylase n=1 Tax=Ruminococcus bromii TaxID=40518 RepID=UPI00292FB9A2|nr:N-6 DNA methylase [Ruminococcus bromii]MDE8728078.1 N-6 DNA methylase [Ruminococcus bromii]